MDDKKISYSPFNTTFNFIIAISFVILLTVLVIQVHKTAAIVFVLALLIIAGQSMFMFIKSFVLFIQKRPAILLKQECFVDNSMGIKISWTDIIDISIYEFNGRIFLAFNVTDNSIIYSQVLNPVQNVFLRLNASLSKKSFMTNLSFLKGKNSDIFEIVNGYYQSVSKN